MTVTDGDYDEIGPWGPEQVVAVAELTKRRNEAFDALMHAARKSCPLSTNAVGRPIRNIYEEAVRLAPLSLGYIQYTEVRQWLEEHGTTPNWGHEDWRRIGTDDECVDCGKPLRRHLQEFGPGYGFCGDDVLYLHRDCSGNLFHL